MKFRKINEPSPLDMAITRLHADMEEFGPESPEYPKMLEYLERLNNVRNSKERRTASPDQILLVAGNLLGILIIVAYEQKHVMASKGLGFVLKSK